MQSQVCAHTHAVASEFVRAHVLMGVCACTMTIIIRILRIAIVVVDSKCFLLLSCVPADYCFAVDKIHDANGAAIEKLKGGQGKCTYWRPGGHHLKEPTGGQK